MSAVVIDLNEVAPAHAQPARYDLDLIVQRLRETAEIWVPRLFPNGKRVGDDWRLANIRGDAPRNTGSCVIALRGPHAGDWIDFDGNEGGGPVSTIEEATGLSGRDLIVEAAAMAGVLPGAPARQMPAAQPAVKRDPTQDIAHILSRAVPIADTPAATYLVGRALAVPDKPDLLFHPDLTYWETRTGYPALLGQVRDRSGEVIGLHRTYLVQDANEVRKAPVAKPKMMLGRVAGGAVRLAPIAPDGRVALCEGIETGLAVMTACPDLPVWATLSTSGMEQLDLPPAAQRVLILADHDTSGAGLRAAEATARRLRAQGRDVAITIPPEEGEDFNDMLLRAGATAVATLIADAQAITEADAVLQIGQHRPLNYQGSGGDIPTLRADEGDLGRAVAQVWSVVMASNRTPWVFRFAGQPTWVVPDDEGRPVATMLNEERLRHMLARLARWVRENAKGELLPAPPPVATVKSVLATPDPALPVLTGIVNTPVFGRNGTLITAPGYHPDARLLYVPAPGFTVPEIPKRPSAAEVDAARALICEDLLGDFPFTGEAERAHVVALLLLGFLRGMIDGPTPLHLIEKPTPGTGATLMVDAVATILTGTGASVMTEGRDDEEWRKRVTAKLRQIPSIILIDNLRAKLDSSAVAAALTAPFWEDRVLGQSEMTRLPIRCLWIATGNNPEFSNEMARRLVRIRLDANVERPWQRAGFRHPDLMVWVRANRARIVAACLTLCQAWIAAGKPRGTRTVGSYENWAQVIGGVLETAGIPGFLGNLEEMMEASDSEGAGWSAFIAAWWDRFGTASVLSADLFDVALLCDPQPPLAGATDRAQKTSFGKAISRMRDRIFRVGSVNVRVRKDGIEHKATRWKLELSGEKNRTADADQPEVGEHQPSEGNIENGCSPAQRIENIGRGERGEHGEHFSAPLHARARARARAHEKDDPGKRSPCSPRSPSDLKSEGYEGEHRGEHQNQCSPCSPKPDWLRELDP
ncbi:toprim domain-containing protein [Rhodobacteraceae bacterium 2376]|uniref:Toprim domain-containing protein n=1 Tax=Rhabdonatronobacter sediminivivens TaxID=2743469 RepID=A0A7Z0L2F5_9RHOB|nr:toprim domain-containing protein [Rhabdonatronobacter sediminivivens]NYS26423.1 toprim domain-containing protein [Rhabdonatronobacter sediminivivens]